MRHTFVIRTFDLLLTSEIQNQQTSAATSQSGRPSLSFNSTYGFSWTRLRSSWRPSKRKARSSWESCCWNPLNLGAYFAMVHYKYNRNQTHYLLPHKIWNEHAPLFIQRHYEKVCCLDFSKYILNNHKLFLALTSNDKEKKVFWPILYPNSVTYKQTVFLGTQILLKTGRTEILKYLLSLKKFLLQFSFTVNFSSLVS